MIEINLLPDELKAKTRKGIKINMETQHFLYLIPLVFAGLVLVHISLTAIGIVRIYEFKALENKWNKLKPQREIADNLRKKYDVWASNARLIEELNSRALHWSQKLNRLSLDLPSGIWFNEVQASRKEFVLKASAVSLQKEEMSLIKQFLDTLKNDTRFLRDFSSLELGSVQKRSIAGYDIIDFILTAKLKTK